MLNNSRVFIASILVAFLFAITSAGQQTRFGLKGGLNYSSVVGDLTEGLKFRLSGHAGVFLEFDISEKVKFQPELLYSSQGFQFSSDLASIQNSVIPSPIANQNDFRTNVRLNYLTIPILMKFALGDKSTLQFGPQFGFLLNQVTLIKNLDEIDTTDLTRRSSVSGDFQLDYGASMGLGIQLSDQFEVVPRAYLGLRNRLNGLGGVFQNYNAALQLSLHYHFR